MPRYKALSALALLGVLISAGSVGSQDPFLARSEAESAAFAAPVYYNPNQIYRVPAEPVATRGPHATMPAPMPALSEETARESSVPPPVQKTSALAPAMRLALASQPAQVQPMPVSLRARTLAAAVEPAALVSPASTWDFEEGAEPRATVAERRLLATVPDEIESYFDLFMYVSKSMRGPLAQRMFVFQRDSEGKILPYAEWIVSTGREKVEIHKERRVRTTTPEGVFVLDPDRFYPRYWSKSWDGAPMHHAMFYDMKHNGRHSGLAIHAAVGEAKIRTLGKRDSAGCIRLAPKHAKELFYKIRNTTQGRIPAFAVNERGSTDRWGKVEHDEAGRLILQEGYRAVLFVENFDGREEVVGPVIAYTH